MVAGFIGGLGPRYYVGRPQYRAGLAYPYKAWPGGFGYGPGGFGYSPGYAFSYAGYRFPAAAPPAPYYTYRPVPFGFAPVQYQPAYAYMRPWSPWSGVPALPGYSGVPFGYQGYWPQPPASAAGWGPPATIAPVRAVAPLGYSPYSSHPAARPVPWPATAIAPAAGLPWNQAAAVPPWYQTAAALPWYQAAAPNMLGAVPGTVGAAAPPNASSLGNATSLGSGISFGNGIRLGSGISATVAALPAAVSSSGQAGAWQRAFDESGRWDRSAMN